MGLDDKLFTFDEVSLHNSSKDCWVIINAKNMKELDVYRLALFGLCSCNLLGDIMGQAYDVTNFLSDHPGGDEVLLTAAEVGHGSAARLMLDEYYVGEIEPSSTKKTIQDLQEPPQLSPNTNHKEKSSSTLWILLLSIAILGSAIAFHFYS
ncbi:hypothetical protein LguiA_030026 [Lonicera macranthoides]